MAEPITARQAEVLAYIVAHQAQHERPPTRAEIAAHFGWASANAAEVHIQALRRKGLLAGIGRGHSGARNLRVLPAAAAHVVAVPPAAPAVSRSTCRFLKHLPFLEAPAAHLRAWRVGGLPLRGDQRGLSHAKRGF